MAKAARGETEAACLCVASHRPPVLMYESHHIWPIGMGGPDVDANRVWLCPTAHYNVHEMLRLMLKHGKALRDSELEALEPRPISRYAAKIARRGYGAMLSREVS